MGLFGRSVDEDTRDEIFGQGFQEGVYEGRHESFLDWWPADGLCLGENLQGLIEHLQGSVPKSEYLVEFLESVQESLNEQ